MSSTVRGNAFHWEECRQKPSWREVHDGQATAGTQRLVKADVGLDGPRDVMVDATHQNRIAAAALETRVGLTRFDHRKLLNPRAGSRRSNLLATLAVDLRGEDMPSRSDEASQLQSVLSRARADVGNTTALAKPKHGRKLR